MVVMICRKKMFSNNKKLAKNAQVCCGYVSVCLCLPLLCMFVHF